MAPWEVYSGEMDGATHIALEELIFQRAKEGRRALLFPEFTKPCLVLSHDQHGADRIGDIDYTRCFTAGAAMLCDANALAFSIATPRGAGEGFIDPVAAHKFYGKIVQGVLAKFGVKDTVLGEQFYIKVPRGSRNLPLVGTAQRQEHNAHLYHGIITLEPWSADYLNSILALRAKNGLREYDMIASLPSVRDYTNQPLDALKNDMRKALAEAITGSPTLNAVDPSLRNGATTLVNAVYRNADWRDSGQHAYWDQISTVALKKGLGFCLLGSEFQQ